MKVKVGTEQFEVTAIREAGRMVAEKAGSTCSRLHEWRRRRMKSMQSFRLPPFPLKAEQTTAHRNGHFREQAMKGNSRKAYLSSHHAQTASHQQLQVM
jgi:hypothetical protein